INEGELQQIGTVEEIWNHPANKFVAYFVGEPTMSFLPGKVESPWTIVIPCSQGERVFSLESPVDQKYAGKMVTIGVRPQQIEISREKNRENTIQGIVKIIEFQGDKTILTVKLEDEPESEVKVVVSAQEKYSEGEVVWLYFAPQIIHLFIDDVSIL
ncbi:MAG TPA: TOBE domain-containing protein, partial [Candidatus Atribacteria bacterium]|nr:TOBE domain-containing protein [Candidatus Atribacteria bacterium]